MLFKLRIFLAQIMQRVQSFPRYTEYKRLIKNGTVKVGRYTYGVPRIDSYRNSEQKIIIGNFCSIGPDVRLITGGIHPGNWVSTFPIRDFVGIQAPYDGIPFSKGDIKIGNDVWIGTGATILSGVTIDNGAIIMAGSMVTKSIPAYAVVGGVPAKIIKYRFNEVQIKAMQKIAWWNWNTEKIKSNYPLLSSDRINEFIQNHSTENV